MIANYKFITEILVISSVRHVFTTTVSGYRLANMSSFLTKFSRAGHLLRILQQCRTNNNKGTILRHTRFQNSNFGSLLGNVLKYLPSSCIGRLCVCSGIFSGVATSTKVALCYSRENNDSNCKFGFSRLALHKNKQFMDKQLLIKACETLFLPKQCQLALGMFLFCFPDQQFFLAARKDNDGAIKR